jgi:hypothetical protein
MWFFHTERCTWLPRTQCPITFIACATACERQTEFSKLSKHRMIALLLTEPICSPFYALYDFFFALLRERLLRCWRFWLQGCHWSKLTTMKHVLSLPSFCLLPCRSGILPLSLLVLFRFVFFSMWVLFFMWPFSFLGQVVVKFFVLWYQFIFCIGVIETFRRLRRKRSVTMYHKRTIFNPTPTYQMTLATALSAKNIHHYSICQFYRCTIEGWSYISLLSIFKFSPIIYIAGICWGCYYHLTRLCEFLQYPICT